MAFYMTDTFIYSDTREEHEVRLQETLDNLKNVGSKLNHKKCLLRQTPLTLLDIDKHGIRQTRSRPSLSLSHQTAT